MKKYLKIALHQLYEIFEKEVTIKRKQESFAIGPMLICSVYQWFARQVNNEV